MVFLRSASASACWASAWVMPVTGGTETGCGGAGPLETTTVTVDPCTAGLPAAGSVEITWPAGTVSLDWSTRAGTSLAFGQLGRGAVVGQADDVRAR